LIGFQEGRREPVFLFALDDQEIRFGCGPSTADIALDPMSAFEVLLIFRDRETALAL
jgi:hypothetical protein